MGRPFNAALRSPMKTVTALLLAVTALSAAPSSQTFTGAISDEMCAVAGHGSMRMGPTDAECTRACVTYHGVSYVLVAGKNVYVLSDQKASERLAGEKVTVVGTLDAKTKTIRVQSITRARSR
jgi:hypothetical protein